MKHALTIAVLVFLPMIGMRAQERPEFRVARAAEPPTIDGILDDDIWKQEALLLGEWVSYTPIRGDKMPTPLRTEVRITYEDRDIYLAFHCFDNEPDRIRTTISRRDSAFNDDWLP